MEERVSPVRVLPDVMVFVERAEHESLAGKILFPYEEDAVPYENTAEMLLKIDEMFERAETGYKKDGRLRQYHTFKEFSGIRGGRTVFFLRILYRQNGNMQGTFFSGKFSRRPMTFRSTMELGYYIRELTQLLEEGKRHG